MFPSTLSSLIAIGLVFFLLLNMVCVCAFFLAFHSHSIMGASSILQTPYSPRILHCFPPPSCCCRDCCCCASRPIFCVCALASHPTFDASHVNKPQQAQKKEIWQPNCKGLQKHPSASCGSYLNSISSSQTEAGKGANDRATHSIHPRRANRRPRVPSSQTRY